MGRSCQTCRRDGLKCFGVAGPLDPGHPPRDLRGVRDLQRQPPPIAPPTAPPPVGTRLLGFFLLGGTMWIAGVLALFRSVFALTTP